MWHLLRQRIVTARQTGLSMYDTLQQILQITLKSFITGPLSKTITFPLEMKKRRERSVRRLFLAVRTVTACPQTIKTHRLNMFFALFPFLQVRMGRWRRGCLIECSHYQKIQKMSGKSQLSFFSFFDPNVRFRYGIIFFICIPMISFPFPPIIL